MPHSDEAVPRRARSSRDPRRDKRLRTALEVLEDRLAPVIGALGRPIPVVIGSSDPLMASGTNSSGIVQVLGPGGSGSGALLATGRDILTAAHVVTGNGGALLPGPFQIVFPTPQATFITVPASAVTVNPNWDGNASDGSDLAIIALPTQAPASAARYPLFTANNEMGQTFTLDAFGQIGVGATGSTAPGFFATFGTLNYGNNLYDGTDQALTAAPIRPLPTGTPIPSAKFPAGSGLVSDFDDGTANHDALGYYYGLNNTGVPNESFAAHGDSGGPNFLGGAIASVVSYGFGFPNDPPDILAGNNETFGEIEVDTRVSYFASWINGVINANRFQVDLPAMVTAGTAFALTVTAVNAYGMAIPGYTGTIQFSTSDPDLVDVDLPANYTFAAGDNGRHTFPVAGTETTLVTAGVQSIRATDTVTPTITGFGNTTVNAAATVGLVPRPRSQASPGTNLPAIPLVAPTTYGRVATGTPTLIQVSAVDRFGNVTPNYRGTVRITSGDAKAVLPANAAFTAQDAGVHVFLAVTFNTIGDQTLTATDTAVAAINGTRRVRVVDPTTAVALKLITPVTATAGQPFSITVQAVSPTGGVATGYLGTVTFSSDDGKAAVVLPPDYKFLAGDNGTHTFANGVTLATAGGFREVEAQDTVNANLDATQDILVTPGNTSRLAVVPAGNFGAPAANVVANAPFGVTVQATDALGNVTPGYLGTVHFTNNDPAAAGVVVPADYTFLPADNGSHTFPNGVTLVTAGARTVTATDTKVGAITGTANVTVAAPVLAGLRVTTSINPVTAGMAFMITVTAQDATGNTITGYLGTVHFTSTDGKAAVVLPPDYKFLAGDNGVHTFAGVMLITAGPQRINVVDTGAAAIRGVANVVVNPADATTLTVTPSAPLVLLGVPVAFTVTARDNFGNIASGYRKTIAITSNDAKATLPGNYTFTALDGGVHTFFGSSGIVLGTAGARTIVATDIVPGGLTATGNVTALAPTAAATLRVDILGRAPSTIANVSAVVNNQAFSLIVSALDANGLLTPNYAGTITFSTTDAGAGVVLPGATIFAPGDLGSKTFDGVKLVTRSRLAMITATDNKNAAITGTGRVYVN